MRIVIALILALAGLVGAEAQERVALLIGNEDYPADVGRLNHPFEDVDAIAAALTRAGFSASDVRVVKDANRDATLAAVAEFRNRLVDGGADAVGFFYYSGHGGSFERRGYRENFLIPAGTDVTLASDLPLYGVSLSDVIDTLSATPARAVFVVSDACRNSLPFSHGVGDADKGFTPEPARPGLFIAHATAEGSTAPDDGLFARALATRLPQEGVFAPRAFELAFRDLARDRPAYRLPTVSNALRDDFCFVSCPGASFTPATTLPAALVGPSQEDLIREAQQLLAAMGYEPGPADGSAGSRTGDAVAAFRTAVGLGSGRTIDADLVATLRFFHGQNHRAPIREASLSHDAPSTTDHAGRPAATGSSTGARNAGDVFRDCANCPEMVVIPAGSFVMGSPESEANRDSDEGPQRTVRIASFAAGKFEVTWDEWNACVAGGGCDGYRPDDQGWGQGTRPVINVSWNDAQSYVRWLNEQVSGAPYRLLTEAEWEYAARGKTAGGANEPAYWWGSSASHEYANYGADSCCSGLASGRDRWETTGPVGSFAANGFGLHDMHGNVWEWVEDCYHDSYSGALSDGSAATSGSCEYRVLRGGSWFSVPWDLRSASRFGDTPANGSISRGFRLARTL